MPEAIIPANGIVPLFDTKSFIGSGDPADRFVPGDARSEIVNSDEICNF